MIKENLRDSITVKVGVDKGQSMELLMALTSSGFTQFDVLTAISQHFPTLLVYDEIYPVKCVRHGKIRSQEELVAFMSTQEVLSESLKNSLAMVLNLENMDITAVINLIKLTNSQDPLTQRLDQATFLKYLSWENPTKRQVTFNNITYTLAPVDPLQCPEITEDSL